MEHPRFVIPVLAAGIILAGCSMTDARSESDSRSPVISNTMAAFITNSGARISWETDESASSQVEYGTGTGYGHTVTGNGRSTDHSVYISGLQAGTEYHYRARSADASGNESMSEDRVFTTTNASAYGSAYYSQWENGPPSDTGFFPLAVWLQSPGNAANYAAIGINTYVGLWQGPTDSQLAALHSSGMNVICAQNDTGLTHQYNDSIKSWMHNDEPDNAQWDDDTGSYTYCIAPAVLVDLYRGWKAADPTRPVLLNFGQGVANIGWYGRWYLDNIGGRDYRGDNYSLYYTEASEAADILSYDIYPVTDSDSNISGKLEYVASGVKNLILWSGGTKPVWNCIETTHINNAATRPTPAQIRSEVWMSIIAGSMGIIYFVHEWEPSFREDGIFNYSDAVAAVADINTMIAGLAPVLNTQSITGSVEVSSGDPDTPVDMMVKSHDGNTYIFSAAMRNTPVTAEFTVSGISDAAVEVLGEYRSIPLSEGSFQDAFDGYGVHLYRIAAP